MRKLPGAVCELGLAPKLITSAEYAGIANYAYHLDAGRFVSFIRNHCVNRLGVPTCGRRRDQSDQERGGDIAYLETKKSGNLDGDLFIDCSGFRSAAAGRNEWASLLSIAATCCSSIALGRASALRRRGPAIRPAYGIDRTEKTAGSGTSGYEPWGVGYVFSSNHTTAMPPSAICKRIFGEKHRDLQPREIKIQAGHRQTFGRAICGRSVSPAASWSLSSIRTGADRAIRGNDRRDAAATCETMDIIAKRFNETDAISVGSVIDFLKAPLYPQQARGSRFGSTTAILGAFRIA